VINCTLVTTSTWSVLALSLKWAWRSPSRWVERLRLAASGAGVAMVLYLFSVELFRIGAICLWCTSVHVTAIAMLTVTLVARASRQQLGCSFPPTSSTRRELRRASSLGVADARDSATHPH
jgi:uncharacterized membrane protein